MSEMTVRQWIAAGVELSILRLASILPLRMLAPISKVVGAVYWFVSAESRQIILDNLSLCFPELSEHDRIGMGRASLAQAVLGYLEKGRWWFGDASTQPCVVDGLEHLQELASQGRGVLLLGFHFSDMETAVQLLNERVPLSAMYMSRPNPLVDAVSQKSRGRRQLRMIERSDVRGVLSALRDGAVLWFAPDQEYRDRNQVPAPFFGMVLSTLSSATRLVKLSGAAVVAFTHHRERDGCRISLSPPLEGFGEDPAADATRVNRILEDAIRRNPSAYFWINRRLRGHSVATQA